MRLATCILVLFLVNCAPNYVIKKSTTCKDFSSKTLVVAPIQGTPEVNYKEPVKIEFGEGDTKNLILSFIWKQLASRLDVRSCFKSTTTLSYDRECSFREENLAIDKSTTKSFLLPQSTGNISFADATPDVILFIDNLHISLERGISMQGSIPMPYCTLILGFTYLYWDNRANEIIAYGIAHEDESAMIPGNRKHSWEELIDDITNEVILDGIYEKKK